MTMEGDSSWSRLPGLIAPGYRVGLRVGVGVRVRVGVRVTLAGLVAPWS